MNTRTTANTITVASLAALLAWDLGGLDLRVARWFGNAQGFALRDNWWASTLLHDGGRSLAWALLLVLAVCAWRAPAQAVGMPNRRQRWAWVGVMLLCAVVVPTLKRVSNTSCPWDLQEFGGVAHYVSHWQFGLRDGGDGHCFPSGHAVAAFCFLGMYFLWQPHDPRRARRWLLAVLGAGAVFGVAQLLRGAHYPSHTFWSGWICWALCSAAASVQRWLQVRDARRSTIRGLLAGDPHDHLDTPTGLADARPLET